MKAWCSSRHVTTSTLPASACTIRGVEPSYSNISLGESRVGIYCHEEWYIRAETNWNKVWPQEKELAMELLSCFYITVMQLTHDIFAYIY